MDNRLIRQNNTRLLYMTARWLNDAPDAISGEEVRELSAACALPPEEAYAQLLAAAFGLDVADNESDRLFYRCWLRPMLAEEKQEKFISDPYYKNIRITPGQKDRWQLRMQSIPAFRPFVRDDMIKTAEGIVLPQIGFFQEDFPYIAVLENDREWMTLMPNETVSTLPAVREARGKVLTYGLGLGYFAYMAAAKADVTSVTVVERDENVIALFREKLLPQFPMKDKLNIIQADALSFGKTEAKHYDFLFADIWHDVGDGLPLYRQLKALEVKAPGLICRYWIEPTMVLYEDDSLWLEE